MAVGPGFDVGAGVGRASGVALVRIDPSGDVRLSIGELIGESSESAGERSESAGDTRPDGRIDGSGRPSAWTGGAGGPAAARRATNATGNDAAAARAPTWAGTFRRPGTPTGGCGRGA